MEEEQKELGFADIMKELGKIMESLQKIMPTQNEPETETEPTPAPQPEPEKEEEPETEDTEKTDVGDSEEIDKILNDCYGGK